MQADQFAHPLDLDEFTEDSLSRPLPGFNTPHRIGAIKVRSADEASEVAALPGVRSYVIRLIDSVPSSLHVYPPLRSGHPWVREYLFDDIEPGADGTLFTSSVARQIIDDLHAVLSQEPIDLLLVHCFAGASRSPAVAGALARMFGARSIPEFASDDFWRAQIRPNPFVFETMMKASLDWAQP